MSIIPLYKVIVSETNEIIQFSKRQLIHKNSCEQSFNPITLANSMLRQNDAVDHIG